MIKTILIDDDFLVLQALETILSSQSHIEVVGMGSNGAEAIQLYEQHQPDLVLMDIRMEPTSGIDAASHILQDYPEAKILFLTTFQDDEYITKALAIGCKGYLLYGCKPLQILYRKRGSVGKRADNDWKNRPADKGDQDYA